MGQRQTVAVLVGSLRKQSFSRKVANVLIAEAPKSLDCHIVEIGDLALYNEDLDREPPKSWTQFRADVKAASAVLFVTPEYNRSVPGVLKNALDVASRPENKSVLSGRPAGVVSVTPYSGGGMAANHALRQTFVFLDMPVMQQPEAYVSKANDLFDAQDKLKNEDTRKFLQNFMSSFGKWVEKAGPSAGARSAESESFDSFVKRRDEIARAYVSGDGAPLEAITAHSGSASFFSPMGGTERGAEAVNARYQKDVHAFLPGSESKLDVFQSGAGDIAFWTGLQRAKVKMQGAKEAREMTLRITEVFRRMQGEWQLVHRHADTLAEPQK